MAVELGSLRYRVEIDSASGKASIKQITDETQKFGQKAQQTAKDTSMRFTELWSAIRLGRGLIMLMTGAMNSLMDASDRAGTAKEKFKGLKQELDDAATVFKAAIADFTVNTETFLNYIHDLRNSIRWLAEDISRLKNTFGEHGAAVAKNEEQLKTLRAEYGDLSRQLQKAKLLGAPQAEIDTMQTRWNELTATIQGTEAKVQPAIREGLIIPLEKVKNKIDDAKKAALDFFEKLREQLKSIKALDQKGGGLLAFSMGQGTGEKGETGKGGNFREPGVTNKYAPTNKETPATWESRAMAEMDKGAGAMASDLVDGLLDNLAGSIPIIGDLVVAVVKLLANGQALPELLTQLVFAVLKSPETLRSWVVQIVNVLIPAIIEYLPDVIANLVILLPMLIVAFVGAIPQIAMALVNALFELLDPKFWKQIWLGAFREFEAPFQSTIQSAWEKLEDRLGPKLSAMGIDFADSFAKRVIEAWADKIGDAISKSMSFGSFGKKGGGTTGEIGRTLETAYHSVFG